MKPIVLAARSAVGLMLGIFWGLFGSPLLCVVLLLALAALSIVRYRFAAYRWLPVAETASCVLASLWWPYALLGLWLPLLGLLEDGFARETQSIRSEADADRAQRLALETQRGDLALEAARASAHAESAERARIAQDIHDHVGHEIAGALIALETVTRLMDAENTAAARALLPQAVERVRQAAEHLRETVHNLKPLRDSDESELRTLCARFAFCPVQFSAVGDFSGLRPAQWRLFESILKEALTNIARHSDATLAHVRLDSNGKNARLLIYDNGKRVQSASTGLGLAGMRERARLAGGSLSVEQRDGFQITCVLPLEGEL